MGPSYAPNWTAFKKYTGLSDPLFKYYEGVCCFFDPYCRAPKEFKATTRGAERGKHFSIGMIGWGSVMDADYVINGILLKKIDSSALLTFISIEFPCVGIRRSHQCFSWKQYMRTKIHNRSFGLIPITKNNLAILLVST